MKVLLFSEESEISKLMAFQLESFFPIRVTSCFQFADVISELLGNQKADLLIIGPGPDADKVVKFLSSTQNSIPTIVILKSESEHHSSLISLKSIAQIKSEEADRKLVPFIKANFFKNEDVDHEIEAALQEGRLDDVFCRIHTSLLMKVVPLSCPIYVRLNATKFIKIFQEGSTFSREEYEKYSVRRKMEYFYIKKQESYEFIEKLNSQFDQIIESSEYGSEEVLQSVGEIHDVVSQLSSKLGFNDEVQSLIKKNVKLTMKAIGGSRKLSKLFSESQLRNKNYLSKHSTMLASVSCSLAAHVDWSSDRTFEKLILASLLHDIHFQNPDLARIGTKVELAKFAQILNEEDKKLILNHPVRCSDLIKTMKEVPSDVDVIVLQHHETPDGKGFPKGLTATQISPLASILIVAHDLVDQWIEDGENFSLESFLETKKELYTMGLFKKIYQALRSKGLGEGESGDGESGGDEKSMGQQIKSAAS